MKKVFAFLTCFALCVPFALSSVRDNYYSYSYARLSYIKGDVFIQRGKDLGHEEGTVNLPVVEGDKLGTREGRAEIHFSRRNYVRIDSYTQLDFVNLPKRGDDRIKLHVLSGNIYLRISYLEREKDFEIHTPDASFYILEQGLYRIDVKENKETEFLVYEGSAEAAGEEGSLRVGNEERLIVSDGRFLSDPASFYARYDDSFSQWNKSRDALLARTVNRRYLPAELAEYEAELAYNGRWMFERPYGHVWVPYVAHSTWRPYYHGRWVWYPIIGWTWVSYDPWGWCVSHYGRWHWRGGLGWYWIPTARWGPAWVHWHWGSSYAAWCPLSYYGYPGVIVNNRYYGRYYSRHYPVHSRALVVIHKRQLHAHRISRVALNHRQVRRLSRINLSSRQPGIRPGFNLGRRQSSRAERVLSRSHVRAVKRSYRAGRTGLSPPRSKSGVSRRFSKGSYRSDTVNRSRGEIRKHGGVSRSGFSSRTINKSKSKTSPYRARSSSRISSTKSRNLRSGSRIKSYPSNKTSSFSRSRSSSSKRARSFSRGTPSSVGKASSRISSPKSRIKNYSRTGKTSKTYTSRAPSFKKSQYSRSKSTVSSRRKSAAKNYTSRSSYTSLKRGSSSRQIRRSYPSSQTGYSSSQRRGSSYKSSSKASSKSPRMYSHGSSKTRSYSSRSYKSKSYKPRSYQSHSYKSKSYTPRSYKSPSYTTRSYKSPSYKSRSYTPRSYKAPGRSYNRSRSSSPKFTSPRSSKYSLSKGSSFRSQSSRKSFSRANRSSSRGSSSRSSSRKTVRKR